jgi:hypothetical protein
MPDRLKPAARGLLESKTGWYSEQLQPYPAAPSDALPGLRRKILEFCSYLFVCMRVEVFESMRSDTFGAFL